MQQWLMCIWHFLWWCTHCNFLPNVFYFFNYLTKIRILHLVTDIISKNYIIYFNYSIIDYNNHSTSSSSHCCQKCHSRLILKGLWLDLIYGVSSWNAGSYEYHKWHQTCTSHSTLETIPHIYCETCCFIIL